MSRLVEFAEMHPWTVLLVVAVFVVFPAVEWAHERSERRRYVRAVEQWLERPR